MLAAAIRASYAASVSSMPQSYHGSTGAQLPRSLAGTVLVANGAVRDFNLVCEVLERLSGISGLAQAISERVAPKYGRLFTATDTHFSEIRATLQLADGRAHTDDLTVTADDFGVRGAGWFSFDRDIDMTGTLVMSKRFSDDVMADVKAAKYVVDDSGRLAIPFELRGKIGQAKPKPDPTYVARVLERAVTRGAGGKLLEKLLGAKRRGDATPGSESPAGVLERNLRGLLGR